jgi:cytochrome c oxidase subunit 2
MFFFLVFFFWGATIYLNAFRAPDDATVIYVVAKQWMWKFQHPEGQREINALHVPTGQPLKLMLTSEDVIHSFFVPDFRIHLDVLPDRYTSVWFQATRPGTYGSRQ